MASNTTSLALMPQTLELPGSLSASIRLFALGALLAFSFVPISFLPGLTYGYINYSQIPLFALCVAVLCCYLVRFETDLFALLILIFLIAISQTIGTIHSPAAHKSLVTPLIFLNSLAIAPAVMLLARPLPVSTLIRLVHRIVNWVLIFLAVECVTRLVLSPIIGAHADTDISDAFYLYKSSLFFVDSNFVGIEILCLLSIMFAFRGKIKRNRWLLAYLLLFASMSRASIIAGICQLVMYVFWRWRVWTFLGMLAAQVLIIGKLFTIYVTQGSEFANSIDGSLSSKLFILTLMTDAYHEADTAQKFFGVGAGNFINLFGILSAHNIVVTFVTELGIGGSLLFAVYIWILSRKCPLSIYLLILPILINGFSLVSAWAMPYFFAALGLLAALRGFSRDGIGAPENIAAGRKTPKG